MAIYDEHDIPTNRTRESFRYHIQFIWAAMSVEEYWTDESADRDRLVRAADEQEYSILIELGGH